MWYNGRLTQVELCMGAKDLANLSIQPICIMATLGLGMAEDDAWKADFQKCE